MSVDPLIHSEGGSQGINPYSYLMNNPMAGTDPTGYDAEVEKPKSERQVTTGSRVARKTGDAGNFGNHGTRSSGVETTGGNGADDGQKPVNNPNTPPQDVGSNQSISKVTNTVPSFSTDEAKSNSTEKITVVCKLDVCDKAKKKRAGVQTSFGKMEKRGYTNK